MSDSVPIVCPVIPLDPTSEESAPLTSSARRAAAGDPHSCAKKGNCPGKAFVATEEQRRQVEDMTGMRLTQDEVCQLIYNPDTSQPISRETLRRHFKVELRSGRAIMKEKLYKSVYARACDKKDPKSADLLRFVLSRQHGWTEKSIHEHLGKAAGVLVVPAGKPADEWIRDNALADSALDRGNTFPEDN